VALRQLALERLAQVLHLLLLDEEVGVARHAELVAPEHVHAREELAHVLVQDRGEEDEVVAALSDPLGKARGARKHARGLHDGHARIPAERVAPFQLHREIEALVEHAREGMRRVEPDRREHGHHLAEEIVAHPLLLRRRPLSPAQEPDALLRERGKDLLVEEPVLLLDDALRARGHLAKDVERRHAVGPDGRHRRELDLLLQARDADLEELVQVRRDDAEEFQPLQDRDALVLGLREDAAVELESLQLPVEEMLVLDRHALLAGAGFLRHEVTRAS
jgi:hypothetical protein